MAVIGARGAASVYTMSGNSDDDSSRISLSTPAGWHFSWWGLSVAIILLFLWAL